MKISEGRQKESYNGTSHEAMVQNIMNVQNFKRELQEKERTSEQNNEGFVGPAIFNATNLLILC
jgi:hypothetical protein